jgi:hypothetical protein
MPAISREMLSTSSGESCFNKFAASLGPRAIQRIALF